MGVMRKRMGWTFGGAGGGALGMMRSKATLYGESALLELVASIDNDRYACAAFEYLTGCPQVCIDAREMNPALMRDFYGATAPWLMAGSPPCQGASKLLSTAKSLTEKYKMLNELLLLNINLILEAWPNEEDRPALIFFENVPNITSRAAKMLKEAWNLLTRAGYVIQHGYHECREVGNLAQRRKRWFWLARLPSKMNAMVYLPPKHKGRVCKDVLEPLPLPGDPAGGPMHRISAISFLNWMRLWKIPAGGDWRDLVDDGRPRRARFRRHHIEKWTEPSVTIGGSGSNGPCGVAQPLEAAPLDDGKQMRFHHVDKVTAWDSATGAVTHSPAPSSGAIAAADPRIPTGERFKGSLGVMSGDEASGAITTEPCPSNGRFAYADPARALLGPQLGLKFTSSTHQNLYRVTSCDDATGAITGATRPGSGGASIADTRIPSYGFDGTLGVLGACDVAPPITCRAGATTGAFSFADARALDLVPQGGSEAMHYGKYVVVGWDAATGPVIGATRIGSGAQSIAQALPIEAFRWCFGVLDPLEPSGSITCNGRIASGANAIAGRVPTPLDMLPAVHCYDKGYAVIDIEHQASNAIAGNSFVGCGTYAGAFDVPEPLQLALNCEPHAGAWGVTSATEPSPTVIAEATMAKSQVAIADPKPQPHPYVVLSYEQTCRIADGEITAPFCIIDPADPEHPLAIIESMDKPPFRWEETVTTGKNGKKKVTRKKINVPLVLISADGTWHRPLTTLELAVLQGLDWMHNGEPLDFGGGSTDQRTAIGNLIPAPAGTAVGVQFLMAGIASKMGCFFLSGGGGIWVLPEYRRELERAGVRVVRPADLRQLPKGEYAILDDAAPRLHGARKKRHGAQAARIRVALAKVLEATRARINAPPKTRRPVAAHLH